MSSEEEPVAWLRQRIRERSYLAQHAIELGNAAEWTELSSGVLMTIAPDAPQDRLDGVHPLGDSTLSRLMEANDPQDTIARCEAELAILDEHRLILADRGLPEHGQSRGSGYRIVAENPTEQQIQNASMMWRNLDCHACRSRFPCRTVRLLAGGYRYRPGFPAAFADTR
jgi:Family of unknown function (DUF6221)